MSLTTEEQAALKAHWLGESLPAEVEIGRASWWVRLLK